VIAHRLVEIDGRTTWSIEAGHPHCANESDSQRVVRVFELFVELFAVHSLAMQNDVEAALCHSLYLVLFG